MGLSWRDARLTVLFDEYDSLFDPLSSQVNVSENPTPHPITDVHQLFLLVRGEKAQAGCYAERFQRIREQVDRDHRLHVTFGWDESQDPYGARPYLSNRTPAKGSSFADPDVRLVLTYRLFHTLGLQHRHAHEILTIVEHGLNKAISIAYFACADEKEWTRNENLIDAYFEHVVVPSVSRMVRQKTNISFLDVIDRTLSTSMLAFSGTVSVSHTISDLVCFQGIETDTDGVLEMEMSIRDHHDAPIPTLQVQLSDSTEDMWIRLFQLLPTLPIALRDVQCIALIDPAAWIRSVSVANFAVSLFNALGPKWLHRMSQARIKANNDAPRFESYQITYWTENHQLACAPDGRCSIRTFDPDVLYLVIFDQTHTIGTDIKLPLNTLGLCSIDSSCLWSKVAQAAYRLRSIGHGQVVQFVVNDGSLVDSTSVIQFAKANEDQHQTRIEPSFARQRERLIDRHAKQYSPDSYRLHVHHACENVATEPFIDEKESIEFQIEIQMENEREIEREMQIERDYESKYESLSAFLSEPIPSVPWQETIRGPAWANLLFAPTEAHPVAVALKKHHIRLSTGVWWTLVNAKQPAHSPLAVEECPLFQVYDPTRKTMWWMTREEYYQPSVLQSIGQFDTWSLLSEVLKDPAQQVMTKRRQKALLMCFALTDTRGVPKSVYQAHLLDAKVVLPTEVVRMLLGWFYQRLTHQRPPCWGPWIIGLLTH